MKEPGQGMLVIPLPSAQKMKKGEIPYILLIVLAIASLLTAAIPSPVLAATSSTTVGTLSLLPAYENISVYSNFSGDDNGNNTAVLEYRKVGDTPWKQVWPFTVDRREQVSSFHADLHQIIYTDNEFKYQWRGIIFWLEPDTEYQVRVTYSDPDGVSGSPVIATVKTRNDNPPSNGNAYYVATNGDDSNPGTITQPFGTIQHAVDIAQAGDKILVMPGVYIGQVTFDQISGAENNYITLQSYDLNDKAVIDCQSTLGCNIVIKNSGYIRVGGLELRYPTFSGDGRNIILDFDAHDIIIEDNITIDPGNQWGCAGVLMRAGIDGGHPCRDILIQRNYITYSSTDSAPRFGIFFWGRGHSGIVIRNNTIIGNFQDGIGGNSYKDIFIHNNYIEGSYDDVMEIEGDNVNVAVWGNHSNGYMGHGIAPVTVGPYYVFRNVYADNHDAALKMGNDSAGWAFIFHNTIYCTGGYGGIGHYGNDAKVNNVVARNNIIQVGRYTIENGDTDPQWSHCDYDYDNLYTTSGDRFAKWLNVIYSTFATFKAGTGFEQHGMSAPSQFVAQADGDFRLQSASPCIDKGVVLPGFNDANSPWPYSGSAPDLGANEYGSKPSIYGVPPFTVSGLSISSSTVAPGETVTIGIEVVNTGRLKGSYTVRLLIAGVEEATQELMLGPGASDTVTFAVARDEAGTYEATVDGLSGSFTVTAAVFPWALLGGILGGVLAALAAAIALYLVLRRRRTGLTDRASEVKR